MSVRPTRPAPLLPPSTYLEEWLADHAPLPHEEQTVRLVISGHPITPRLAAQLATITGYPAEFWLTHQARYNARL